MSLFDFFSNTFTIRGKAAYDKLYYYHVKAIDLQIIRHVPAYNVNSRMFTSVQEALASRDAHCT